MKSAKKPNSEDVLAFINPPEHVASLAEFENIVDDTTCLTFIEKPFFDAFKKIATNIKQENINGDIINIGIYRGGGSLYMKAVFEEMEIAGKWWLFDSFLGFNNKGITNQKEVNALKWFNQYLAKTAMPSANNIQHLFSNFDLDNSLTIVEGYIEDTYHKFDAGLISLLHIDVDFYDSTYNSLFYFYQFVSEGGWIIIDDYFLPNTDCKCAVDEFRLKYNIKSQLIKLGNYQVGWKKNSQIIWGENKPLIGI